MINYQTLLVPQFPEVKGIHLGGCIEGYKYKGKPARFRRIAHTHNHKKDPYYGMICVLSAKPSKIYTASGEFTLLALHEIAHMLAPNRGHDQKWADKMMELGGKEERESRYYHLFMPKNHRHTWAGFGRKNHKGQLISYLFYCKKCNKQQRA